MHTESEVGAASKAKDNHIAHESTKSICEHPNEQSAQTTNSRENDVGIHHADLIRNDAIHSG